MFFCKLFTLIFVILIANQSFAQDMLYILWENANGKTNLTAYKIIMRAGYFTTGENSPLDLSLWQFAEDYCQIVKVDKIIVDHKIMTTFFKFNINDYNFTFNSNFKCMDALIVNDFELINKLAEKRRELKSE